MTHPILIITSDPSTVKEAKELLEKADLKVRILDTTKSSLLDFLSGLADIEQSSDNVDTPKSEDHKETDEEIDPNVDTDEVPDDKDVDTPKSEDDKESDEPKSEEGDPTKNLDKSLIDDTMVHGTVNGEEIEIHTVDGKHIVLHPITVDAADTGKVKFTLTESQFNFWCESKNLTTMVELDIPSLSISGMIEVEVSELTQTPPVLLIGTDWIKTNTKDKKD